MATVVRSMATASMLLPQVNEAAKKLGQPELSAEQATAKKNREAQSAYAKAFW